MTADKENVKVDVEKIDKPIEKQAKNVLGTAKCQNTNEKIQTNVLKKQIKTKKQTEE